MNTQPIADFIKHHYRHFNSAALIDAAEAYKRHLADGGKMMVTLAGAMSPVTLAGALTEQNAEVLFMATLAQLVRPGAPVIYGGFTSNVDMRSGAPAFGTPEYAKAAFEFVLASSRTR